MKKLVIKIFFLFISLMPWAIRGLAQIAWWHNKERTVHYQPRGNDFILYQGTKKFNRALYGSNTGFRVEAGDQPEFAMYMPGMGGNCKIGIMRQRQSKWITAANNIQTIYRPGAMLYTIKDPLLQNGSLAITALALANQDGMILKLEAKNIPKDVSILILYGGATGKKFSRDGDIGADPESSFYLQPHYCKDNYYTIQQNRFLLHYGFTRPLSEDERYEIQNGKTPDTTKKDRGKIISGIFPVSGRVKLIDATHQETPLQLWQSTASGTPAIAALLPLKQNGPAYFIAQKDPGSAHYSDAPELFAKAEAARAKIAGRIIVETPDAYINTLGAALSIAADAIWEAPTYLHGAVAWRMRLPAWRGAYTADPLGWHDRARMHFESYIRSQVTHIPPGPVSPDTALHLARQLEKMGTALFSNGYICRNPNGDIRPHHYDMNLVFMDQLFNHFNYTGDTGYVKKMWPAIKLHLQWERRNFDADGDGLYDAYACIWASDALQYSGGGVTHSTAYNYRANKTAAFLARLIDEDAGPYEKEAEKIFAAAQKKLWLGDKGCFAEYVDLGGLQRPHPAAGLWTIYHAIDGKLATARQRYQMLRYIDAYIPHIPIAARGLSLKDGFLLATTNWQPYTWSINNVALAENLNTALAYWQSGERENAYRLWRNSLIESMYLSSSPGGFQQLSFYDAARGELYRDFADPIGVASRTLTEGLFGILPDALNGRLLIRPGFPQGWNHAALSVPDIRFSFKRGSGATIYKITQFYRKKLSLTLSIAAPADKIKRVTVNNQAARYTWAPDAFGNPQLDIAAGPLQEAIIKIEYTGAAIDSLQYPGTITNEPFTITATKAQISGIDAPHFTIVSSGSKKMVLRLKPEADTAGYAIFVTLKQGDARWIKPLYLKAKEPVSITLINPEDSGALNLLLKNHTAAIKTGRLYLNNYEQPLSLPAGGAQTLQVPAIYCRKGTNTVRVVWNDGTTIDKPVISWNLPAPRADYEIVDLSAAFNDNVAQIFRHQYRSPRPASPTLQIPWQGIGNWCYPLVQPEITDAGLKNKPALYLDHIPFKTGAGNNICFTSLWDTFPDSVVLTLKGKASHAYFIVAGSTNHQQAHIENARITVQYTDGSAATLPLVNPANWWPVEQDYMNDGYAFTTGAPRPYRVLFKSGVITRNFEAYQSIKGFTGRAIEGGAGTVVDLPLDDNKTLASVSLRTLSNEVVAGLMSITLVRK
ncbi:DUF4450 domain-containing protein [Niabella hirudinis]|uniref:DUF4450 domain-containing protein n=1 Tax=Niabella hirudinis TaxID=1285929 RepID=UPI003EBE85AD